MKRALLVGDSGGTGTDWCLVDRKGEKTFFSSASYQPVHFSDSFFHSMKNFWQGRNIDPETEIHLYGAGCSMKHNQEILTAHFSSLGFHHISVESDLLGACRGLLKNSPGFVGILGTGSVLAEYNGREIVKLHGGYGYLLGDEGSGYTFGKMLLHAYLTHDFSEKTTTCLFEELGDRTAIMQQVYGPEGKRWISSLASRIERLPEIEALHVKNIRGFISLYLSPLKKNDELIYFSGSYAYYNAGILEDEMHKNGWKLDGIVKKPIESITDYTINTTL